MAPPSRPFFVITDTSSVVEAAQLQRYRQMSVERKLELVEEPTRPGASWP